VSQDQLEVTKGKEHLSKYDANKTSSKTFCSICGSSAYLVNDKHFSGHFVIPLGSINNYEEALVPQIQVYTSNKAVWLKLHEDEPVLS